MSAVAEANRNRTTIPTTTTVAGLLQPGDIVRTVGGFDRVDTVNLASDHAAVVVVRTESDPKARRFHCDERVRMVRA